MNALDPKRVWILSLPLQCTLPPLSFFHAAGGFCVDECYSTSDRCYRHILLNFSSSSAIKWAEMETFLNRMNFTGQRWSRRGNAQSGHCAADLCMHPGFRLMQARLHARDPRLLVWRGAHCGVVGVLSGVSPVAQIPRKPVVVVVKKEEDSKADIKPIRSAVTPSIPSLRDMGSALRRIQLDVGCIRHGFFVSKNSKRPMGVVADVSCKRQRTADVKRESGVLFLRKFPSIRTEYTRRDVPRVPPLPAYMVSSVPRVPPLPAYMVSSVPRVPPLPAYMVSSTVSSVRTAFTTPPRRLPPPPRRSVGAPVKQAPVRFVERENDSKWTTGWAC